MPMQVDWPMPRLAQLAHRFVGQRAGARDHAHVALPGECAPGMMPILHLPGEMMPGQFGPISRVRRALQERATPSPCRASECLR